MHEQPDPGKVAGHQLPVAVFVQAADVPAAIAVWRQEHLDLGGRGIAAVNDAVGHATQNAASDNATKCVTEALRRC
jgi:hypothetical protein